MRHEYAGRVIDGPDEGKFSTMDAPWYRVTLYPGFTYRYEPIDYVPVTTVLHHGLYRWSKILRGWVFDWSYCPEEYVIG